MAEETIRVLLIEDDDIDREIVRRWLGGRYVVDEAPTGRKALELYEAAHPDCVLLDYRLPDADGLELLSVFAQAQVPVVMLTGEERPEVIVEAMQQGAQDYLVKGNFSGALLERALLHAIEKAALRRALEEKQQELAQQAVALREKNRQLRTLASALTLAEQRERRRISHILHEHLQQVLFGAKLSLQSLRFAAGGGTDVDLAARIDRLDDILGRAVEITRTLSVDLNPPVLEGEGLDVALRWLAGNMEKMHGLKVDVRVSSPVPVLEQDMRVLLLQLVRELLFNVVKHAGVNRAFVRLQASNGMLLVTVEDAGIGFDPEPLSSGTENRGGYGLYSIRERLELFGGRLDVRSVRGKGTQMIICVPAEGEGGEAAERHDGGESTEYLHRGGQ